MGESLDKEEFEIEFMRDHLLGVDNKSGYRNLKVVYPIENLARPQSCGPGYFWQENLQASGCPLWSTWIITLESVLLIRGGIAKFGTRLDTEYSQDMSLDSTCGSKGETRTSKNVPSRYEAPIRASTTSASVLVDISRVRSDWFAASIPLYSGRHFWPVNGCVMMNWSNPARVAAVASELLDTMWSFLCETGMISESVLPI